MMLRAVSFRVFMFMHLRKYVILTVKDLSF
jgi:hypothetical protein